jgi:N-acyl-L-homoserine lactone synthetase
MIYVVDSLNAHEFSDLLIEMHQLRARVFSGRLGWEVEVENGMERDAFDDLNPAHVISVDESGRVVGCSRMCSVACWMMNHRSDPPASGRLRAFA